MATKRPNGEQENPQKTKKAKLFDFSAHPLRKIAIQFFYLGWEHDGLVQQVETKNTVEHHLMEALLKTRLIENWNSCGFSRCGRTDKGVSAFRQTAALNVRSCRPSETGVFWPETSSETQKLEFPEKNEELQYIKMLNGVLPKSIRVFGWSPVAAEFNARFDCNRRTYKYAFPRADLDLEKMRLAARLLIGEHDFSNFCQIDMNEKRLQQSYTRKIYDVTIEEVGGDSGASGAAGSTSGASGMASEASGASNGASGAPGAAGLSNGASEQLGADSSASGASDGASEASGAPEIFKMLELTVSGSGFLWHMIRFIVSVLHEVGRGNEQPELVSQMLDLEKFPSRPHYSMAADTPLCLFDCGYDNSNLTWQTDEKVLNASIQSIQKTWSTYASRCQMMQNMLGELTKIAKDPLDLTKGLHEFIQDRPIPQNHQKFETRPRCETIQAKKMKLEQKIRENQEKMME